MMARLPKLRPLMRVVPVVVVRNRVSIIHLCRPFRIMPQELKTGCCVGAGQKYGMRQDGRGAEETTAGLEFVVMGSDGC